MKGTEFKSSLLSIIGGGVVVTGMLLGHEQVRLAMLAAVKPHGFTLSAWTIYPQWFSVILFIILLVTALVVVVVMLRWFVCSPFRANASQTKMVE
jgi:hypothetical protein